MLFKTFANTLQDIESASSRLEITAKLADLFKELSVEEMGMVPYLVQGRIAPAYAGIEFGVAEKSILKAAAKALGRDPKDFAKVVATVGDLGHAIESERAMHQSFESEDLTIAQVFAVFLQLSSHVGEGSQDAKASLLGSLFTKLDPLSCRYIARIPLGQLRLGASDITIMDALSWMVTGGKSLRPAIERAYQLRPDLSSICTIVKQTGGVEALSTIEPVVGTPILMMRAERLSSGSEIVEKLGECQIEPKYDGLRLQIHVKKVKSNDENQTNGQSHDNSQLKNHNFSVRIFTRGLEDATHMYPDIVVAVDREIDCESVIFEGEALGYDYETGRFLPFQETIQRKRKHDIADAAEKIPLKLMAFDILYLNGRSLIPCPLHERREMLVKLLEKVQTSGADDVITMAPENRMKDPAQIEALFDQYTTDGLEGIMAKKLADPYKPGAREYSWVKLKRSYSEKVTDTIDCVVLGFDHGKGKRAAFGIGAVLVGIFDPSAQQYVSLAKIGTGMTDDEWKRLRIASDKLQVESMPQEYEVKKEVHPDVWVLPAIVLEIRCDELTASKLHSSGWSMRFPRLERFRDDKKPVDATNLDEIKKMVKK